MHRTQNTAQNMIKNTIDTEVFIFLEVCYLQGLSNKLYFWETQFLEVSIDAMAASLLVSINFLLSQNVMTCQLHPPFAPNDSETCLCIYYVCFCWICSIMITKKAIRNTSNSIFICSRKMNYNNSHDLIHSSHYRTDWNEYIVHFG